MTNEHRLTIQSDAKDFELVYDKRSKKIFSYLMTILNYNRDDAHQVLSDVFIALFEYNQANHIENIKTFLYVTAHNKAVDLIKKVPENYKVHEYEIDKKDIEHKKNIDLTYKQKLMQKYLQMLQPREKEIVHLYFYENKSYEEIADLLWTNKNTIGTLLFQAKKKIKEIAQREWSEEVLLD